MKQIIILVIAITASFAGFAQKAKANTKKKTSSTLITTNYICPMHPDVTSDKPGKCSKCGMDLNLSPKEKMKQEVMKIYTCPMHPDVTSDKPGKCSECGMDLVGKQIKAKKTYTCAMHPDVTSDKPGKCSKCGMDLNLSPKEKMKMEVMKIYTCPMHPDVTSSKPGKCTKCNMDLKEKKEDHSNHQH